MPTQSLDRAAGLLVEIEADPVVSAHWVIVEIWSEQSRYQVGRLENDARKLVETIENEVLPWIKARW